MVLPLTWAAPVESAALPPLEEHAAKAKAMRPTSARRVNCFESLRTWFSSFRISKSCFARHAALAILPPLMHLVHTRIRRAPPCGSRTRTNCRFGLNRRGVRLFACDTLLPNCGPLPQASHFLAMMITSGSFLYGFRVRTRSGSDGIDAQLDFMIRSHPPPHAGCPRGVVDATGS